MRVLQAMAGADVGGAEAFFVRLVLGLHKAGLEQRVVIRENPARAETFLKAGIEPIQLPFGGALDFKTKMMLRRQLREFRPHVALSWMNRATAKMPRPKLKDVDYVHVARLGGYYNLKYYQACDHLIGNTQDIVEYVVKEGWPPERAHYLPNFVAADRAPAVDRAELHVPKGGKLVLALGRLHRNKAFDVLLHAVAELSGVYLAIAGEGPERDALEELALKLGVRPRVRFLGWRDDVAALLAACDLFVCPSRHEPLGNVVIEAWAQEKPVVAAASQGPTSLIADGDNGLLVPVDDAGALAQAMKRVLASQDLARDLGLSGRVAYEADYTEEQVVRNYLDFFQQVAN